VRLYRTANGCFVEQGEDWYELRDADWQALVTREDLAEYLEKQILRLSACAAPVDSGVLAPIGEQEVWAAGVTYYRSRTARMEESQAAGGGDFYDRVYHANRPELFFKATPHRVVGPGAAVHIRKDSQWNVPEPELTVLLSPSGKLLGYTIGNDVSSRDIEGENPLYLPQAKVYDRSCGLGPCILVACVPLAPETTIRLEISRKSRPVFSDQTTLSQLKRTPGVLAEYLFRENSFPKGCFLLTGTGIVPPDDFTLECGDDIRITIPPIGTLQNSVD
jgi:2-dehydro-3-deoxy-D-arabinonate dehydratase